jgi:hypothetical protein
MADQDQEKKKRTFVDVDDECAESEAPPPTKKSRGEVSLSSPDWLKLAFRIKMSLDTLKRLRSHGVRVASVEFPSVEVHKMDDPKKFVREPREAWHFVKIRAFPTKEPEPLKFAFDDVFEFSIDLRTWKKVEKAFEDILPRLESQKFQPEENPFHGRFLKDITEVFDRVETRLGEIQLFDHSVGQNEGVRKVMAQLSQLQEQALREGVIIGRFKPGYPIEQGNADVPYQGWPGSPRYSPVSSPKPSRYSPTHPEYVPTSPRYSSSSE